MIFDPNKDNNLKAAEKLLEVPDSTATQEAKQGKKIGAAAREEYAAEMRDVSEFTLDYLQQKGRDLIGHVLGIQDQSLVLGSLAAALEAGAYRRATLAINDDLTSGATEGSAANNYRVSCELANVADSIHKLLATCDDLTINVRKYAEAHLEIPKSSQEPGLGLTNEKAHEYLAQNEGRSIDEVELQARWIVENFEDVINRLRLHLDALIGSLQEIAKDEYRFLQALLTHSPEQEYSLINRLVADDQASRKELLEEASALRASIQDESAAAVQADLDSGDESINYSDKRSGLFIGPIIRLRASLLAEASE
jgi:hypothetical protein